ncbi:unnamed protein product, partial [Iphiclides podalirius]
MDEARLGDRSAAGGGGIKNTRKEREAHGAKGRRRRGVHAPPPRRPHAGSGRPLAGATHRTAKIESVGGGAGSNGAVERSAVTHTGARACARREGRPARERDGRANYYHLAGRYRITHCRRARDDAPAAPRPNRSSAPTPVLGDRSLTSAALAARRKRSPLVA